MIEFQFEKIREVFRVLLTSAAATAATLLHGDLNFRVQSFGAHQVLQCLLFERHRFTGVLGLELHGRRIHLVNGILQVFR